MGHMTVGGWTPEDPKDLDDIGAASLTHHLDLVQQILAAPVVLHRQYLCGSLRQKEATAALTRCRYKAVSQPHQNTSLCVGLCGLARTRQHQSLSSPSGR